MDNFGIALIPLGLIAAAIIGYLAVKKHWKIADIF